MSKKYDIIFVGHMCYDEIIPFGGKARIATGPQDADNEHDVRDLGPQHEGHDRQDIPGDLA